MVPATTVANTRKIHGRCDAGNPDETAVGRDKSLFD